MMKLTVLSLLVAVALGTQMHPLSDVTAVSDPVVVTALFPTGGGAPTITTLSNDATYDSSVPNPAIFHITGTATYAVNNTISTCDVTYTGGGDTVVITVNANGAAGVATLTGASYPVFLATTTYTATAISCRTQQYFVYTGLAIPGTAPTVAATKYTKPTLTAYNLVSPQAGGCDDTSCSGSINGTAMTSAGANLVLTSIFRNPASTSGVFYLTDADVNSDGTVDFNVAPTAASPITANIGGLVNGVWTATQTLGSAATQVPKNIALPVSALITQGSVASPRYTQIPESSFTGSLSNSVTFNVGSTDVTPPTCTSAIITPATIMTSTLPITATVTVACADTGGSNLWIKGAFVQGTVTNGPGGSTINAWAYLTAGSPPTFGVQPYVSGTLSIVGVFAVDNAGNAVLYGSCGGAQGYDSICGTGGGSSSASTVALSLFTLLFLAIYALFA